MDALQGMTERTVGPAAPSRALDEASDPVRLRTLREAAREFEALFVRTLLRAMRNTIPEAGIIDDQGEIKYYRQLFDEELADTAAGAGGGLGVAQMIVRQYLRESPPEPPAAQPARHREALQRYRAAVDPPGMGPPRPPSASQVDGATRNGEAP
jgi:flagellar protein FlgJ